MEVRNETGSPFSECKTEADVLGLASRIETELMRLFYPRVYSDCGGYHSPRVFATSCVNWFGPAYCGVGGAV